MALFSRSGERQVGWSRLEVGPRERGAGSRYWPMVHRGQGVSSLALLSIPSFVLSHRLQKGEEPLLHLLAASHVGFCCPVL